MAAKLADGRGTAKNGHSQIRNQNSRKRNQISPVMQKVRGLLPPHKSAHHLAILIDEPLGTCQKLLCGERAENPKILTKLLRSELGRDVLFDLMGDARPKWFSKYRKQLDVNAEYNQLRESQRRLEALQRECLE
ncbi:hypothetical protein AFEL58S_02073 [Afipia felis]